MDENEVLEENKNSDEVPKKEPKKKSYKKGVFTGVIISVASFAIAVIVVISMEFNTLKQYKTYKNTDAQSTSADLELDTAAIARKIEKIERYLNRDFLYDKDTKKVEESIYKGMMAGLDDKYAEYYTEKEYEDQMETTSGEYAGIGAMLQEKLDSGIKIVIRVFEDSPAEKGGLLKGDILLKANDVDLTVMDLDTAVSQYIRGEAGTDVDLTVLRGEEEVVCHITRQIVLSESVTRDMAGDIGIISVSSFEMPTEDQFKKAIEKLTEQGMKKMIIDLRDNPGGLLEVSVHMADYILEDDLITYTADKNGNGERYVGNDGHSVDMPIVVLVNQYSASASEIFTGALKDHKKAKVIGQKTFGKGIVQNVLSLGDGTGIKYTVMNYYTPSGFDLNGEGITPDIEVEIEDEYYVFYSDDDITYHKALEFLGE